MSMDSCVLAKYEESEMNRPLAQRIEELEEALTDAGKELSLSDQSRDKVDEALTALQRELDQARVFQGRDSW